MGIIIIHYTGVYRVGALLPKYNCEAPITGVYGGVPSAVRGRASGQRGRAPVKLKHFWLLDV